METGECLSFVTLVSGTGIAGAMMSGPLRGDVQATVGRPFTATVSCATIAIVDLPKLAQLAGSGMIYPKQEAFT
jgi:ABC-type methionine transport system permease subunit